MKRRSGSFTRRIIAVILLATLIPLALSLSLSAFRTERLLREQNVALQRQRLSYTAQYLDSQFAAYNDNLLIFAGQSELQTFFKSGPRADERAVGAALANLCYASADYSNAYVCSVGAQRVLSAYPETGGVVSYDELRDTAWFEQAQRVYDYAVSLYPFSEGAQLACVQPQRNPATLEFTGCAVVKIKTSTLRRAFSAFKQGDTPLHCITADGTLVSEQEAAPELDYARVAQLAAANPGSQNTDYGGYTVCWAFLDHSDILIFSLLPRSAWRTQSLISGMFGALTALVCIGIGLVACIFYLRRFLSPVNRLADAMQSADLDHLLPIPLSGRTDEIGVLERRYNDMVENFNGLLEREYRSSLAAREAQISALQFQINPHFVNNTLQMIGSLAVERGMMDVYELLGSFSSMFYYCLKYKGALVTLQDELDYLANYLKLQARRYPDKFEVAFEVDENAAGYEVPKMLLQPIVENCFAYAFQGVEGDWRIRVRVALAGEVCEVRITDNGCGMTEERLAAVMACTRASPGGEQSGGTGSIGLRNVNFRLRLLYGEEYQLRLASAPGAGTTVLVRIPPRRKGDEKDV